MRENFFPGLLAGVAGAVLTVVCSSLPALAALGEDVSSFAADQARLQASSRLVRRPSYSVEEMQTRAGTTVRQFISPAGIVFAVSWQGSAPDLQQLLGIYFEQFEAGVNSIPSRRGRGLRVDSGDLLVETGGHMRFVTGRALLRSKLPAQVTSDDIR